MADKLMPLFPEHKTYVEVFGGSGAILINKKPSEIEVYNDIEDALKRVEICRELNLRPFAQPYLNPNSTKYEVSQEQRDFVSWVNQREFFQKMPFRLFKIARHNKNAGVVPDNNRIALII